MPVLSPEKTSAAKPSAKPTSPRVLLVEDTRDIAELVRMHLSDAEYQVEVAFDGANAAQKIAENHYDLAVLDLTLPGGVDGLELCRRLRAQAHYTLILMLTSRDSELDRVLGLELGADDYLTKPFSIRELLARVKALLRRTEAMATAAPKTQSDCPGEAKTQNETGETETIRCGQLVIEVEKRKVTLSGVLVNLTAKEFDLLYQFACHPGRVYTRTQLLDSVWGFGYEGYEHTVNSHINRLRTKIEKDPAHPHYLLTVWGVGYKFCEE